MDNLQPELTDTQKLFVAITSLSTAMTEMRTTVTKDHKLLVEGNGEIPLIQRVRDLETFVSGVKSLGKVLIAAIIVQTVAFGTAVIWTFIKIYPLLTKLADGTFIVVPK